ncbi:DUF5078 domain-containing protein [Segniliparus rugosus]|uniref:Uncharacterized protein n=1 Tax=Segniliparus rugosus (strain ATCC BAA-974 / DSM 45345 / CCUG 50838 / CIP 108380 / JCM 13579 / CDC 945) TaxID=679197 RepID=E5XKJ3_SEGRC|nr:DUF5078 domain-containing protein [Segniliparus rugosus]EFV15105.1 hypothetical protein HMPREF9336_00012 [Segniliparus rugosus ATCC BAA-974]
MSALSRRARSSRLGLALLLACAGGLTQGEVAAADPNDDWSDGYFHSTDQYPIPKLMLLTTCTPDQMLAVVKKTDPREFARWMTEFKVHSPEVQQGAIIWAKAFFSMEPGVRGPRRDVSERIAGTFGDLTDLAFADHAKIFFSNHGIARRMTEQCKEYPKEDPSTWDW